MKKTILFLFFALGFFSLLSQTLIIREFIVSFGGNELGIGLFYFFWFFWVGIGAWLVSPPRGKFFYKHFYNLAALYPVFSFLQIFLFVSLRGAAGINWWEFFSPEKVFFCLFAFTSLLSLATGMIFTLGVCLLREREDDSAGVIGAVYIYESLGSFCAGGIVTLLITKLLSPILILAGAGLFFYCAVAAASVRNKERITAFLSVLFIVVLSAGLINHQKLVGVFQARRMKNTLPAASFIKEVYTPYQHILIGKVEGQIVVAANGGIIAGFPDEVSADKESALFIAQANLASNIFVCGAGAENLIASLLKFPVARVTYCLPDKVYYEVVRQHLPAGLRRRLEDPRLKIVFDPARVFLRDNLARGRHTRQEFDLVVVYPGDPDSLTANTFFTREFYALARENMSAAGLLVTRITAAENFIGQELSNYGASVYYTLGEVFSKIIIVPGDTNLFLAGGKDAPLAPDPLILEERFKKIVPRQFSFSPLGFRSMLDTARLDFVKGVYVNNDLFKRGGLINRDCRPLTFFLNLLVMARHSQSCLVNFFKAAFRAGPYVFIVPLVIFFLARLHFLFKIEPPASRRRLFNSKLFQFSSGFLGFSFHLALIFLFQNKFGTIFQLIGLVNALFMMGLCAGAVFAKALAVRFCAAKLVVTALLMEGVCFLGAFTLLALPASSGVFSLFIVFFFLTGMLTGSSYPLVAKIMQDNQVVVGASAADLVLLDYWGAALAGLLAGVLMFPLLGMGKILVILFVVCIILSFLFGREFIPAGDIPRPRIRFLSFPYIRTSYCLAAVSLVFLINAYILRGNTVGSAVPPVGPSGSASCRFQEEPFYAQVCLTAQGKEYILESKNFVSGIKGFGGRINLRIRVDEHGRIKEVKVIEHQETDAYVAGIDKFLSQFTGRALRDKFSRQNVNVITGATVTSMAAIDIINEVARKVGDKLDAADSVVSQEGAYGRKEEKFPLVVDAASLSLIIFTVLAIAGFVFFSYARRWRKIYLISVVIFSGIIFNLTFSFFHLANLLMFNWPLPRLFSLLLIYLIPLGLGIFFGPLWCGWLCPFGALQELVGGAGRGVDVSKDLARRARYFKYVFLAVFVVVISCRSGASLFRQEPLSVFFLNPFRLSGDKILSFVVLVFSFFFFRFWCRYFCVCGAFFSLFNKISLLKKFFPKQYRHCCRGVEHPQDIDCIQCNLCLEDKH